MKTEDVWQTYYNNYNIIDLNCSNIESHDSDNNDNPHNTERDGLVNDI